MYVLLALCFLLAKSSDVLIYKHHVEPISIDKSKGNFSVTAINVPKSSFLIASYSNFTDIRIENNEWVRNYKYYSIENYMKYSPSLYISPSTYLKWLSFTICSFTEAIPRNASIVLTYNFPVPQHSDCESSKKNFDCPINAKKVSSKLSKTYSIREFSNKFFYSSPVPSKQNLEIKVLSGNLHSFFKYSSNESLNHLASFLNPVNDLDSSSKSVSFSPNSESNTDNYISLSVFCFDRNPCNFTIKLKKSGSGSNSSNKYKLITVVIVVTTCVVFVGLWCILIGCRRIKNEGQTESLEMIDKMFPLWTVDNENRQKECSVCFEDYEYNKLARKSACGHIYHADCIQQLILKFPYCPLCRSSISNQLA